VVRYYGGVRLGAGGLVRAYTDCVAQALKSARKIPLVRLRTMVCAVPYGLEGLFRREIDAAGGSLQGVQHGEEVELSFGVAEVDAEALVARLNEAGQGRVSWRT